MKHLVIIGAGGMGRTVYSMAVTSIGYNEIFDIKGFIDDNPHALDGFEGYPPYLDRIDSYQIEQNDVFVCSIGDVQTKYKICSALKLRGAVFQTLINSTAIVNQNAVIGEGTIVAEFAIVGNDARIGENCLVQSYAIVAHDCIIGDYVRIDTHCTCVGGTVVRDRATLHTSAVISHFVTVEENAIVGGASFVIRNVKKGTTVCGNPARKLIF